VKSTSFAHDLVGAPGQSGRDSFSNAVGFERLASICEIYFDMTGQMFENIIACHS
jgi:hypothetical protein